MGLRLMWGFWRRRRRVGLVSEGEEEEEEEEEEERGLGGGGVDRGREKAGRRKGGVGA